MARETLDLFIKVTDSNGAATFQRLGAAGKKATDEIIKGAKSGATSLKEMEQQTKSTAKSAEDLEKKFTKVGVGIGTVVTAFAAAGNASREQTRQVDGIRRAYGEAADEMLSFASAVQESSNFSDDAARQSLISIQGLANQYGITQAQIEGLVTRSADLAQINGLELQDAVQRTSAALRGEGESAEALGLNLSDTAVAAAAAAAGLTGWNTTMTEGEKAAFRYTILMEQSAFATGAAAEAAEGAAGRTREFLDDVQNLTAGLGDLAGPAAEAASILGSFALAAPLAGAGLGKLAAGAATAAGASGLGGLAVGIAGVGLAAGVAIIPLAAFTAVMIKGAEERSDEFTADFDVQTDRLNRLGLAADENAKKLFDWVRTSNQTGGMANGQVQALNDSYDELIQLGDPYLSTLLFIASGMDQSTESAAILGQMIEDLSQTQLVAQTALYGQGLALEYATSEQQAYTQSVEEVAAAEERLAVKRAGRDTSVSPLARPRIIGLEDPNADDMGLPDYNAEVARSTELQVQMAEVQGRVADGFGEIKAEMAAELSAANQELIGFVAAGENIIDVLIRAGGALTGNQGFLRGVRDLTDAQGALDSTFNTIIGGVQDLAQSGQTVADWASELTGITFDGTTFVYEVAAIDAALASGRISQEEYNAAVVAGQDILYNNNLIQQDTLAIQAQQAPLIAERTNAYQDQIAALAALEPAEQRHRLLMMDSGVQAQVASGFSTAYAASLGEIPEDVATEIILAEARGNADTEAIYRELGLIEGDWNSDIKVNFPDGASMTKTLGTLNETLEDLIEIIAEVNGLTISPQIDPAASAAIAAFTKPTGGAGPGDGTGGSGPAASDTVGDATGGPLPGGSQYARGGAEPIVIPVIMDYSGVETGANAVEAIVTDLAGGEYTVNIFADGKQAQATITDTEGRIVAVVDGDWIIPVNADGSQARDEAVNVEGALEAVVGGDYVATINGDGTMAHSAIDSVNAALNYINGTTGVIYINGDGSSAQGVINSLTGVQGYATIIVNAVRGTSAGFTDIGLATGGTIADYGPYAPLIPSYATGGSHAMVGEHGPEMVWLPNGSQVTNAVATESRTRGDRSRTGGRGDIIFKGPVTLQARGADAYNAIDSAARAGVRR